MKVTISTMVDGEPVHSAETEFVEADNEQKQKINKIHELFERLNHVGKAMDEHLLRDKVYSKIFNIFFVVWIASFLVLSYRVGVNHMTELSVTLDLVAGSFNTVIAIFCGRGIFASLKISKLFNEHYRIMCQLRELIKDVDGTEMPMPSEHKTQYAFIVMYIFVIAISLFMSYITIIK